MPTMPTGSPLWFQIACILLFLIGSPLLVILNYYLKDKRKAEHDEDKQLVDGQQGFIDRILRSAEMAPALLDKVNELLKRDEEREKQHAAEIADLQRQIDELKVTVRLMETDRDHWRDQAGRVPILEGMLTQQAVTVEDLRRERDDLKHRVSELEMLLTAN